MKLLTVIGARSHLIRTATVPRAYRGLPAGVGRA